MIENLSSSHVPAFDGIKELVFVVRKRDYVKFAFRLGAMG